MMLEFNIRNQEISRIDSFSPAEKSVEYLIAKFNFKTEDWSEATKRAIFRNVKSKVEKDTMLEDDFCIVPWEVLVGSSDIEVSVHGVIGTEEITTNVVVFNLSRTLQGGSATQEPSPTVYEQMAEMVKETKEIAQSVRTDADNGKFNGPQGPVGKDGKSAYEIAVAHGFEGSEEEWLESLQGENDGKDNSDATVTTDSITKALGYKPANAETVSALRDQIDLVEQDINALSTEIKNIDIPSNVSDLNNDSGFITRTVQNLANYYLKSETYSAEEIDNKISAIPKFSIEVVASLPTTNISNTTVYLIASGNEQDNLYTEYIYINGKWEYLGKQTVDLSGYVKRTELSSYYTKTEIDSLLQTIRNSIPTKLAQMTADATHRTVTDTEKQTWNNKSNFSGAFKDLTGKPTTLAGYGITDGATKEELEQLQEQIADQILVMTESELEVLTQEELVQKYAKGTKIIITKENAENLVPTSTDSNGNVYCGCGYKNNYRLKSDGSIVEARHSTVTGFMPCVYGSKISVVGWGANEFLTRGGQYIGVFDGSYNFIEVIDISALLNLGVGTTGSYKNEANEITIDTSKRTSWKNMKYFRVSCVNTGDNVIATVDKY